MTARTRSCRPLLAATLLAVAVAGAGGCYKRVVKAEGIGAESIEVRQSNRSNTVLDRAFFGGERSAPPDKRPPGYTPRD